MRECLPCALEHENCNQSARLDPIGTHRLGCKSAADARLRRHDCLASFLAKTALAADARALQVSKEARVPDSASQARPGDVALDMGDGRAFVDLTVVNPFSVAHLSASRSAGSPALAAERAFNRKVAKYASLLNPDDGSVAHFVPLAVTALGIWDECSLRWLRQFANVCVAATAVDPGLTLAALMMRLSVAL